MNKFFVKKGKIYYDDTDQGLGWILPEHVICDILNTCENNKNYVVPSNCIDFNKYPCSYCGKEKCGHSGSWNEDPYLFFCSRKCHDKWIINKLGKDQGENNVGQI